MASVLAIPTSDLTAADANIKLRFALTQLPCEGEVGIAVGCSSQGQTAMFFKDAYAWQFPGAPALSSLRLRPEASQSVLTVLKRCSSFRLYGDLRQLRATPSPLHPNRDWWLPKFPSPFSAFGMTPTIAVENWTAMTTAAEIFPFVTNKRRSKFQPCRFVPVHELHERIRTRESPRASRLPELLLRGGVVQMTLTKLMPSTTTVRFAQQALALAAQTFGLEGSTSAPSPVLYSLATARPIFRCKLMASSELVSAIQLDTCLLWQKASAPSQVKEVYSGTAIEDFDDFFSDEEMQSLLGAFFIPQCDHKHAT